jgi:hypothetical protein
MHDVRLHIVTYLDFWDQIRGADIEEIAGGERNQKRNIDSLRCGARNKGANEKG